MHSRLEVFCVSNLVEVIVIETLGKYHVELLEACKGRESEYE